MAKCVKKIKKITYVLSLSEAEAATLVAISRKVGGASADSPRGHMANIADALLGSGIDYTTPEHGLMSYDSAVRFSDYRDSDKSRKPAKGSRQIPWFPE